ncbi:MAG: alpha-L-fucosidase [Sphingobacteriia bacterium]|nr:alpha-L-fucosidase [Sphingobacteriia bacterium]
MLIMSQLLILGLFAQSSDADKMEWFADAKLGIFIHWGIYSVNGTSESWSFHNRSISYEDYMRQIDGFRAENYHPEKWVDLILQSGARYAVITSKHHDGVALWDTRMNNLSIPHQSPAGRDVLLPFIEELRKAGLKAGLYYSLIDWSYPDYPGFLRDSSRYKISEDSERWRRFLNFYQGQMDELLQLVNPDLWWFDGDWEHSAEEWKAVELRSRILKYNPNAVINGRLKGYGDYETPEQNFPVSRPDFDYWELCMTTNNSWGWQPTDSIFKTPYEIISIFADAISLGGNLLLDIGPKADGTIPEQQITLLKELGDWTKKHDEAIFGTKPGIPSGHFYGPTTLSKDSTELFLFLAGNPTGKVVIKGLFNEIRHISVVGTNQPVPWKIVGKISWSEVPGLVYIDVSELLTDKYMNVLKVEFDESVRLYQGKGGLGL